MKVNSPKIKIKSVYADWKDTDLLLGDIKVVLKEMGVHMEFNPEMEGTDMIGLIFSKKKLTKSQIKEHLEDEIIYTNY